VIELQRAVKPLPSMLSALMAGFEKYGTDPELQRYLRDVQDHAIQVTERVAGFREILQNILSVNLTLVGLQQNDEVKKVSAWAAILFAPTLIGTIYGMNFEHMPELAWRSDYAAVLAVIAVVCSVLFVGFRRAGWI
jgi:magnesium transporter